MRPASAFESEAGAGRRGEPTVAVDGMEFRLLNEFQRAFPLVARPYAVIAEHLETSEAQVRAALARLHGVGVVSRVGPVFAPRTFGASTLAAIAAPEDRLEECAALINAHPGVNHNYLREHRFNLWFVVTAPDRARLADVLERIAAETGCAVLKMPLLEEFHIDLGFDLAGVSKAATAPRLIDDGSSRELRADEWDFMLCLQDGIDFSSRPFCRLAERMGGDEERVLQRLNDWTRSGFIKRFGIVVRHHELGYRANAMVVWDVPDQEATVLGMRLAREEEVTLCYRRARHLPDWPYNLFCMIHGRERQEVLASIARLTAAHGLGGYQNAILFSTKRYKQQGARYAYGYEAANG